MPARDAGGTHGFLVGGTSGFAVVSIGACAALAFPTVRPCPRPNASLIEAVRRLLDPAIYAALFRLRRGTMPNCFRTQVARARASSAAFPLGSVSTTPSPVS